MEYDIRWVGNVAGFGSIDEISRNMAIGLRCLDKHVLCEQVSRPSRIYLGDSVLQKLASLNYEGTNHKFVRVFHRYFNETIDDKNPEDIARASYITFETDRIPKNWVKKLNNLDGVIVPSSFNIDTFSVSGVDKSKIYVCQHGIDQDFFNANAMPFTIFPLNDRFTFLHVSDFTPRKSIREMVIGYTREFSAGDNVALLIKSFCGAYNETAMRKIIKDAQASVRKNDKPPIFLYINPIKTDLMPSLYTSCQAFVLPSKGEGVGIPYLEAMACGVPVVGTSITGQKDFLTEETAFTIDTREPEYVEDQEQLKICGMTYLGHKWSPVAPDAIGHAMRRCYSDSEGREKRIVAANKMINEKYSIMTAARRFLKTLDTIVETKGNDKK